MSNTNTLVLLITDWFDKRVQYIDNLILQNVMFVNLASWSISCILLLELSKM